MTNRDVVARRGYEAPVLRELGSLAELTEQSMNKIGGTPDIYTVITNGVVVGSLVPYDP